MSLVKIAELADEFAIKLVERQYESNAPDDVKSDSLSAEDQQALLSLKERNQMRGHGQSNLLADDNELNEKIWNRAKKSVKKYWNKYDEPWAVVYDVYRKMGGKPGKKKKKKS